MKLLAVNINGQVLGVDIQTWNTPTVSGCTPFLAIADNGVIPPNYCNISSVVNWNKLGGNTTLSQGEIKSEIVKLIPNTPTTEQYGILESYSTVGLNSMTKVGSTLLSGGILSGTTFLSGVTDSGVTEATFATYTGVTAPDTFVPFTTLNDLREMSGFVNGAAINISYNHTNRTITLTGGLDYYWNGVKYTLTSPWTSTAHSGVTGAWFLSSSNGTNFTWSQQPWIFQDVQVGFINYKPIAANSFGVRETHGTMQWQSHEEFHREIGTYLYSGGQAIGGSYSFDTATDAAVTPDFAQAIIADEDLQTTIPQVTVTSGYTKMHVSGSTSVFTLNATHPFTATAANQFIQINNVTTGAMTNGVHARWYNVYQLLIPVMSDSNSQKYRMVFLQPQVAYTSLASAIAEDTRGLSLGDLSEYSPEFTIYARITYVTANVNTNYGKVTIPTGGLTYVAGSRGSLISIGGVSATNHLNLANLNWIDSGHIGSISNLASFDATGNAENIPKTTYSLSGHTHPTLYAPLGAYQTYTGTTAPATYKTITSVNYYTGTTAPNTYYNKTQINSYTGATNTAINNRLLTSSFNTYSGTTVPNTYYNKTQINNYTGATNTAISNRLLISSFNTYSGTTVPGAYYNKTQINSYTGATNTAIGNRLLTTSFNTYSGTTVPNTYYNKTQINSYTGATNTAIGNRLLTSSFNTYSGTTVPNTYATKANAITGATNLGTANALYTSVSANKIQLKSISGGTGISISTTANQINICSTASGGGVWGTITGTITNQTDLNNCLNSKQATITGGATSIVSADLTTSRALVSDGSGKVAVATTTATEIGYVNGVTSNIQTQLTAKITGSGVLKITVGTTQPSSPTTGDLWVDTNA